MADKEMYLRKELTSSCGAGESSEVTLVVEISTGKAELVIEKTYREYYPVTDYEEVMQLHKDLNRGGGRRCYSLKELTK